MKLTFTERKALLQLRENPFLSPATAASKRSMALIWRLEERGLVMRDEDDDFVFELTDEGHKALEAK